jgi:hypothetical protein
LNIRLDSFRRSGGKTDIDTLIVYCNIIEEEHRREAESCVEDSMYRSSELIERVVIQIHGVHIFSVYASLNVMLMNVFLFL